GVEDPHQRDSQVVSGPEFKGGSVAFGGSNGRITYKGKIKAGRLAFKDVYYVEELKHYNLFSVSQMCDKKNKVLFIDTDCLVLSPDFKLLDENQVLLKILRQHNMYSFNLKNTDPSGDLSCLFAKASIDESNKWHRRLGHVNFKNLNKLMKGNLVRGFADDVGAEADINNMESIISVSPIPTTRIHKDHPTSQIIGDLSSTTQTRSMVRGVRD
nr:ribonuclease H-like domain-containing protein [Tanacetum cinerariifolium]